MTNHNHRIDDEAYDEARDDARNEAEKIAPEKETLLGDLKDAVSTIVNDDGRMDTEYNEEDYDRAHPGKA